MSKAYVLADNGLPDGSFDPGAGPTDFYKFGVCTRRTKTYSPCRMFCAPVSLRRRLASASSPLPVAVLSAVFRRVVLSVGCLAVLVPSLSRAQSPGTLDTSFNSSVSNANLFALSLEQINGVTNVFVGGDADDGALLDSTGLIVPTTTFNLPVFGGTARIIYVSVPEQVSDGSNPPKLLLGGLFGRGALESELNETARNITRINTDGSVDTTFNPGTGAKGYVTDILPLSADYDGGIVVAGLFTEFAGQEHDYIVRLDNTGAVVPSSVFDSKLTFDQSILSLAAQQNPDPTGPQGQILAAGLFSNVNGNPHSKLARINADGSVDETFRPAFDDRVRVVISQADGKILAGGDFQTVNGATIKHLVRLNYDGTVDTSFTAQVTTQPPLIDAPVAVNAITPAINGGYYIGGNFYQINGVTRNFMGRVLADGTVDSFDPSKAITNAVQRIQVDQVTNLVYVTETRSKSMGNTLPPELIRLFGDTLPTPKVNIRASIPASEGSDHGQFSFSRTATKVEQPLTVYFTFTGTAMLDPQTKRGDGTFRFLPLPTGAADINGEKTFVLTFPANVRTLTIDLASRNKFTGSETVELTLQPDPNDASVYRIGKRQTATVTLTRP